MADEQIVLGREAMTQVFRQLNQRPIAYYGVYADLMGSVPGGVYLSQVMYWWGISGDAFYKTDSELMKETRLSAREIRSAKYALKKLECITVKAKGSPPVTHYAVDSEKLFHKLASLGNLVKTTKLENDVVAQFGQNDKIDLVKMTKSIWSKRQNSIDECAREDLKTEITTETLARARVTTDYSAAFNAFYQLYPNKTAKAQAWKSWKTHQLATQADRIMADVTVRLSQDERWQRGIIPNPSTYLNQQRWNDEWQPVAASSSQQPSEKRKLVQ
jgi:hypothetical protein